MLKTYKIGQMPQGELKEKKTGILSTFKKSMTIRTLRKAVSQVSISKSPRNGSRRQMERAKTAEVP